MQQDSAPERPRPVPAPAVQECLRRVRAELREPLVLLLWELPRAEWCFLALEPEPELARKPLS